MAHWGVPNLPMHILQLMFSFWNRRDFKEEEEEEGEEEEEEEAD